MQKTIIIDCYTGKFSKMCSFFLSKLSWVEDLTVGKYHQCPECSQIIFLSTKSVEEVEEWLNKRKFKGCGLYETWIGVVELNEKGEVV